MFLKKTQIQMNKCWSSKFLEKTEFNFQSSLKQCPENIPVISIGSYIFNLDSYMHWTKHSFQTPKTKTTRFSSECNFSIEIPPDPIPPLTWTQRPHMRIPINPNCLFPIPAKHAVYPENPTLKHSTKSNLPFTPTPPHFRKKIYLLPFHSLDKCSMYRNQSTRLLEFDGSVIYSGKYKRCKLYVRKGMFFLPFVSHLVCSA